MTYSNMSRRSTALRSSLSPSIVSFVLQRVLCSICCTRTQKQWASSSDSFIQPRSGFFWEQLTIQNFNKRLGWSIFDCSFWAQEGQTPSFQIQYVDLQQFPGWQKFGLGVQRGQICSQSQSRYHFFLGKSWGRIL